MKRANHLLPLIADPDNLRNAVWKAAKGKRQSRAVLAYGEHLEDNLVTLRHEILSAQVEVGDYRYFKIYEPKERQICASAFREQVLHHALMNICHPWFDKQLIYDCYASRKNKGTYAALKRAQLFCKKHEWYLKLDVRKFFDSIHHGVLKRQLERIFRERHLLRIFGQIIDSFEISSDRGVPIGNLTSQYFANHFLSSLDHFIKEQLKIRAYVRYMDDMILWHSDKRRLKDALCEIESFVRDRLLGELKPAQLNRTCAGLPFLGYRIFPSHLRLLQKSKLRFIRKLKEIDWAYEEAWMTEAECYQRATALFAFVNHADSRILRRDVLRTLEGAAS